MSRVRVKDYNTIHHLTSRVAHRAFFLKEDERTDFVDLMKRVTAFSGVELLGWCIMKNHFHIFVYLPVPPALSDEEVMKRFALLGGDAGRVFLDEDDDRIAPSRFAESGGDRPEAGADPVEWARRIRSIRRRMYSIAEYMRMIKKWFTDDYNSRNGHKGTLWEAPYWDTPLRPAEEDCCESMREIRAYIDLNPIRGAATDRFDGYAWSSYTAFREGDPVAIAAIRRVYPGIPDEEIVALHERRMAERLEAWKFKRAKEIARKRMMGYEVPSDPLTDECMIAQAKAHLEEVRKALERLHAECELAPTAKARRGLVRRQIECALELHPDFGSDELSRELGVPKRTVQRHLAEMRKAPDGAECQTPRATLVRDDDPELAQGV